MKKWVFLALLLSLVVQNTVFAWDGYDYQQGSSIEIGKGNLVRPGSTIEIYDYGSGSYKDVDVESVNGREVEVFDNETGETRTFEMED